MTIKEEFESYFGNKSISELTREEFAKTVQENDKFMEFVASHLTDLSDIAEQENAQKFLRDQFKGTSILFRIMSLERTIGTFFAENEGKEEVLKEYCENLLNETTDQYDRLPIYLVILATGLNIELDKTEIAQALRNLILITNELDVAENYDVVCEFQDLIYNLGQYYYTKYDEDPITDMPELQELTEKIVEYVQPFLDQYQAAMEAKEKETETEDKKDTEE